MIICHKVVKDLVPFRNRNRMSLRPINRIKHVVDSQFATVVATVVDTNLALATDTPTLAATASVETGSTINGIYLNCEATSTAESGVLPNIYLMVFKNPGGNLTFPAPNVVGSDDNKKYVIHQEMKMLDSAAVDQHIPRTIFNGVIAIPKHLRRFGPNDALTVRLETIGITSQVCLQCHYKEFR